MTISPMFRERFQQALYDKLQSVQSQQLEPSSGKQQQQNDTMTAPHSFDEWIN